MAKLICAGHVRVFGGTVGCCAIWLSRTQAEFWQFAVENLQLGGGNLHFVVLQQDARKYKRVLPTRKWQDPFPVGASA